ncbi:hypothetical protein VTO73DRAFT_13004 [Trametes versicolor]
MSSEPNAEPTTAVGIRHHDTNTSGNTLIRQSLPQSLQAWRLTQGALGSHLALWKGLHEFFEKQGYSFWSSDPSNNFMSISSTDIASGGFGYAPLTCGMGEDSPLQELYNFSYPNPTCQAAQAADGRSVVIRVLAMGDEGREHVDILKLIARGAYSLLSLNHTVPLLELLEFEDITFGVFPKIGTDMRVLSGEWNQNSVGDILDMIMQCLEALGFIHSVRIAHRDAFKDNFLLQWQPESLRTRTYPISRPRVYLNDFETAVHFPPSIPETDRLCVGLPLGASFPGTDAYGRPVPPELQSDTPYDPFKLDVWQFATSFEDFESNFPEIDEIMASLRDQDPSARPSAYEAAINMANIVSTYPPYALHYPPGISRPSDADAARTATAT